MTALRQEDDAPRGFVTMREYLKLQHRCEELEELLASTASTQGLDQERAMKLQIRFGLTAIEGELLTLLTSRDELCKQFLFSVIWGMGGRRSGNDVSPKMLDVYICKIRKRLADKEAPDGIIETIWGKGWRIAPQHRAWLEAQIGGKP